MLLQYVVTSCFEIFCPVSDEEDFTKVDILSSYIQIYIMYYILCCHNWLWLINKSNHIDFNLGQERKDLIWQEENNKIPQNILEKARIKRPNEEAEQL